VDYVGRFKGVGQPEYEERGEAVPLLCHSAAAVTQFDRYRDSIRSVI
jgi:hypothetical protein